MNDQFSSRILYILSYSLIGENHSELYADFTQASQAFETYQRQLVGPDYHQCAIDDLSIYQAQIEIPHTISFINEAALLAYVNSPEFTGKVTKTPLNISYLQSTAE